MMRSIWKGHIRFSLVTIPIRIYNAVDTEETIRFNQLHKEDNGPVGYEKKCKKCSKNVFVIDAGAQGKRQSGRGQGGFARPGGSGNDWAAGWWFSALQAAQSK